MSRRDRMFMKAFEEANSGKNVNIIALDFKHTKRLFKKGIEILETCSFADNVKIVYSNNSFEFLTNGTSPHGKPYIDLNTVRVRVHEMKHFDWDKWKVKGYSKHTIHHIDNFTIEQKFARVFEELRGC